MDPLYNEFLRLRDEWKKDTQYQSSVSDDHPAYKAIIAMGWKVVPFIMEELKTNPDWWFSALTQITKNYNVVAVDNRGNLKKMTEEWLLWWDDIQIIWKIYSSDQFTS